MNTLASKDVWKQTATFTHLVTNIQNVGEEEFYKIQEHAKCIVDLAALFDKRYGEDEKGQPSMFLLRIIAKSDDGGETLRKCWANKEGYIEESNLPPRTNISTAKAIVLEFLEFLDAGNKNPKFVHWVATSRWMNARSSTQLSSVLASIVARCGPKGEKLTLQGDLEISD